MNRPVQTPIEDLRQSALKHYNEASSKAHFYNSDIPKAINAYYDGMRATVKVDKSAKSESFLEKSVAELLVANKTMKYTPTQLLAKWDIIRKLNEEEYAPNDPSKDTEAIKNRCAELGIPYEGPNTTSVPYIPPYTGPEQKENPAQDILNAIYDIGDRIIQAINNK